MRLDGADDYSEVQYNESFNGFPMAVSVHRTVIQHTDEHVDSTLPCVLWFRR